MTYQNSDLISAIHQSLEHEERARHGLMMISSHKSCTPHLRREIYAFEKRLGTAKLFEEDSLRQLQTIFEAVEALLEDRREMKFLWFEGCASEGYFELMLPDSFNELAEACAAAREFRYAIQRVLRILCAERLADRILS